MLKVIEILGEPIQHGGQEKFLLNLLSNIKQKIAIDVLTPYQCDNESFRSLVQSKGGKVFEFHQVFNPGQSRRSIYKPLLSFLKENQYDIAHIHSGSVSVLAFAAKAAKKAGIKKILVHSHASGFKSLKHLCVKALFGQIIKHNATHFLACSYEAGEMKYPADILRNKLIIIQNGIQIDLFKRDEEIRSRQRAQLGIKEDVYVLGHVGRFDYNKNQRFLVDIFKTIRQRIPDSCLLLVGDGEMLDEVKQQAADLHLENDVIFTGNTDRVQDYYQAMDVFLFPSIFEGLGYVLLEAQAAGLPCIASDAVTESIVLSEHAVRIELQNRDQWIQKIIKFKEIEPTDNTEKIIHAGYDIKNTIKQIEKIYQE